MIMAGTLDGLIGPTYISSRSADVILSDVRPIKLKLEALRAINVLLDEFLYNLLDAAGSISTDKLKSGLIKILPTSLGKEAILEAELELKAYLERSPPSSPILPSGSSPREEADEFDLQWSYELLRLKCEAYSTMNDVDEDTDAEKRLNERMATGGDRFPPRQTLLAPASLYLTAILEFLCERTLSKVSRVAARDSSRALATVQDLFVALCEDHTIYGTFRSMKVYEQIEALSKTQNPRRSKSISGSTTGRGSPAPRASSVADTRESISKLRISTDSITPKALPLASSSSGSSWNPVDMSRAGKMFNRSSNDSNADRPESLPVEISRVQTSGSRNGSLPDAMDDSAAFLEDFDELMRSGTTMKVSLTPDRLRTMEVYKQEKKQRHKQNQTTSPKRPDSKNGHSHRNPSLHNVDAIVEDDEYPSPHSVAPSSFQTIIIPRPRQISLTNTTAATSASARARSASVSAANQKKKTEMPPPPLPTSITSRPYKFPSSQSNTMDGRPPRTRRVAHKRESMDLDEVMGASDDDLDAFPQPPKSATRSFSKANHKPSTPSQLSNGKPYISKAAKELIDFLDEGPPEETQLPPSNPSMISFQSGKTKSGRFQRMISRLTLGGSRENLNGANLLDNGMRNGRMGNRVQRTSSTTVPPPSYFPSSLSSKRSMPNVIIAAPPRLPLPPHPPSPPSSSQASTEDVPGTHSASSPSRRLSIARKAVPTFDDNSETPPVPRVPADDAEVKAPLSRTPSSSAVLRPMNGTGQAKSVSIREYMDHRKDAAHKLEGTATSIASDRTLTENASPSTPTLHITSASTTSGTGSRKSIPRVAASEKEAAGAPKQPVVKENKETSTSETYISVSDLADMRRLLSAATNADECRLIVDMFLARNGVVSPPAPGAIGKRILPPPRHPRHHHRPSAFVAEMRAQNEVLERSLVAALLGSDDEGLCASSSSETEIVSSSSSDNLSERDNVKPPLV